MNYPLKSLSGPNKRWRFFHTMWDL
nr:unnamed protein product [Callosobruchus chinensis]CAH7766638.1 unnamed protein product [Callosobruchus chinensis]